ncbi:MAG: OadG family protein [Dehalococcoidia bacterium]|nr:OadG family protein [Dehalococcoidia bacterium]
MMSMTANWGEASLLAVKGFGTVFLVLVILAALTWLLGFIFQRVKGKRERANSSTGAKKIKAKR